MLAAQLVILLVYSFGLGLTLSFATSAIGTSRFERYAALWAAGIEHMRTQASPMEPDNGVKLIFVTVIGLIMIMTDLLVSGIGRPAWAIAPPATLFLVPALGLGTDTGVLSFCYIAVGYLAILVAEGLNTHGALDPRAFSGLGGRFRRRDTGGLARRRLSRGHRPSSRPSCSGLSCRPCPCQASVSAAVPVATVRCS